MEIEEIYDAIMREKVLASYTSDALVEIGIIKCSYVTDGTMTVDEHWRKGCVVHSSHGLGEGWIERTLHITLLGTMYAFWPTIGVLVWWLTR